MTDRPYDQPPGYPPPPSGYWPPGYGPPPASPGTDVGAGLRWAWNAFTQNAFPMVAALLIWAVAFVALFGIPYAMAFVVAETNPSAYSEYSASTSTMEFGAASVVLIIVACVLLWFAVACMTSAVLTGFLKVADGQPVALASFLKPTRLGAMLGLQSLVMAAAAVGMILCIVPGILVIFFTLLAPLALLDRGLGVIEALKTSIGLVKANVVPVLLMYLIGAALGTVGQLACLVGLFVAIPVTYLYQVYVYRAISGRPVAPLGPAAAPTY